MVTQVTSFSRSGLSDWLIQRVTSLILLSYFLCIAGTLVAGVDYASWHAMHQTTGMRIFTLLAVLSLAAHAWIGLLGCLHRLPHGAHAGALGELPAANLPAWHGLFINYLRVCG